MRQNGFSALCLDAACSSCMSISTSTGEYGLPVIGFSSMWLEARKTGLSSFLAFSLSST